MKQSRKCMYIKKTKNKTHRKYTIEEKNQIVLLYLDRNMAQEEIIRTYDLASGSISFRWIKQYKENGTCVDNRGEYTKLQNPNKGRNKRVSSDGISESNS